MLSWSIPLPCLWIGKMENSHCPWQGSCMLKYIAKTLGEELKYQWLFTWGWMVHLAAQCFQTGIPGGSMSAEHIELPTHYPEASKLLLWTLASNPDQVWPCFARAIRCRHGPQWVGSVCNWDGLILQLWIRCCMVSLSLSQKSPPDFAWPTDLWATLVLGPCSVLWTDPQASEYWRGGSQWPAHSKRVSQLLVNPSVPHPTPSTAGISPKPWQKMR